MLPLPRRLAEAAGRWGSAPGGALSRGSPGPSALRRSALEISRLETKRRSFRNKEADQLSRSIGCRTAGTCLGSDLAMG